MSQTQSTAQAWLNHGSIMAHNVSNIDRSCLKLKAWLCHGSNISSVVQTRYGSNFNVTSEFPGPRYVATCCHVAHVMRSCLPNRRVSVWIGERSQRWIADLWDGDLRPQWFLMNALISLFLNSSYLATVASMPAVSSTVPLLSSATVNFLEAVVECFFQSSYIPSAAVIHSPCLCCKCATVSSPKPFSVKEMQIESILTRSFFRSDDLEHAC